MGRGIQDLIIYRIIRTPFVANPIQETTASTTTLELIHRTGIWLNVHNNGVWLGWQQLSGGGIEEESGTWTPRSGSTDIQISHQRSTWHRAGNRCFLDTIITSATHNGQPMLDRISISGFPFVPNINRQDGRSFICIKRGANIPPIPLEYEMLYGEITSFSAGGFVNWIQIHNNGTPITNINSVHISMSYEIN